MPKLIIKSNEYITITQMKNVIKSLKKNVIKPKNGFYEIWLPVDGKRAQEIDKAVKEQIKK